MFRAFVWQRRTHCGLGNLSAPRIALDAVRMLADRDGPLKVPLAHVPKLAPWLWSFLLAGQASAHERSTMALTELSANAVEETERLFGRAKMSDKLQRDPALYLYESDRSYESAIPGWKRKGSAGRSSTHVAQAKLGELEPALASIFKHGVLSHEWGIVSDPYEVVCGLFEAGRQLGVAFRRARIERLGCHDRGPFLHSGGTNHRFEAILVAAGVWSRALAASLSERLPLEAERGYNRLARLASSINWPGFSSRDRISPRSSSNTIFAP
jgi:D-amino-acid dehydrogenase